MDEVEKMLNELFGSEDSEETIGAFNLDRLRAGHGDNENGERRFIIGLTSGEGSELVAALTPEQFNHLLGAAVRYAFDNNIQIPGLRIAEDDPE